MSIIDTYVHSDNTEYEIADSATRTRVSSVEGKIPSGASSSNKMATASDITTLQNNVNDTLRDAEVIDGKNLLDPKLLTGGNDVLYSPIYVGNGQFTLSTTAPQSAQDAANLFLLAGNVSSGISTATNGVWTNHSVTVTSVDGYVTVASRGINSLDVRGYNNQLEKGASATTYEPYYIPLKDSMFPRSEQAVLGAKNILKNLEYSASGNYEVDGITYAFDASTGIVTANGTASADSQFMYALRTKMNFVLKKGRYILSGCPSGGASNSYRLQGAKNKVYNNPSAGYDTLPLDVGSGATWDLSENAQIQLSVFIPSGATVSNLVFKPMIRLASDSDDTYAPYAMTNKELTERVQISGVIPTTSDDIDYTHTESTSTINPNTGRTFITKIGKLRILSFYIGNVSVDTGAWKELFRINESIAILTGTSANSYETVFPVAVYETSQAIQCRLSHDGKLSVLSSEAISNKTLCGQVIYVAA